MAFREAKDGKSDTHPNPPEGRELDYRCCMCGVSG